jgi:N6-L-threonylcarbamoyladenine synthase
VGKLYVLGIESTAHTFGVGIVSGEGEILANVRRIYKPSHGGIHPRAVSYTHLTLPTKA